MWTNYSIIGFECETYSRIQVLVLYYGKKKEGTTERTTEPERTER